MDKVQLQWVEQLFGEGISMDINSSSPDLTEMGKFIDGLGESLNPYLGSLSGEILGGFAVTFGAFVLFKFFPWLIRFLYKKVKIKHYVLIPYPTNANREHLAHQLIGFSMYLNEKKNKNFKNNVEFIVVSKDTEEIDLVIKKISSPYRKIIIITTMSHIFNMTLESFAKRKKHIPLNIKIVGTLGSESEALDTINQPAQVIRVFPPDFDEAKIAYNFLYIKLLSYLCCNDEKCQYSHKLNKVLITCYHSESYGAALNNKFSFYFNNKEDEAYDKIYPFSFLDANIYKDYTSVDFEGELDFTLDSSYGMYFIYIVGYEPNMSKMLNHVFDEIKQKNISLDKVCFLLSPTYDIMDWKIKILDTIGKSDFKSTLDRFFYLKSKIPAQSFHFKKLVENNQLKNIFKFQKTIEKQKILLNDISVALNIKDDSLETFLFDEFFLNTLSNISQKPNYINTFAYTALITAKAIDEEWDTDKHLHAIKDEAFKKVMDESTYTSPEIYANGDSINHFVIRQLKQNTDEE